MAVRALVVGSFVVDLAFQVPTRPRPGEVVVATEHGTYRGGKGYNQAVALARLGAEVTMIGAVGGDAYGDDFLDSLEREGIDASRVVQLRGSATAVAVPLITPDGAAAFVQSPGANRQLSVAHCADLPDAELLLLQGEVLPSTSAHAGRVMRRRGAQVLLRPSPVDEVTEELRDLATVVVAGPVETASLLGDVDLSDDEGAVAAAQGLARDGQLGVLMLRTLPCGPA
jgi:ribokinase